MTLSSSARVAVVANVSEATDLGTRSSAMSQNYRASFSNGTGAGQADRVFHDKRTLAASATENLDLAGGVVDPFGATVTFARVKSITVKAADANTNDVIVGGDVTNTFFGSFADETDAVRIRPGGVFHMGTGQADPTGYPVAAGTGDLLKVANAAGGTSVEYEIVVIGASA